MRGAALRGRILTYHRDCERRAIVSCTLTELACQSGFRELRQFLEYDRIIQHLGSAAEYQPYTFVLKNIELDAAAHVYPVGGLTQSIYRDRRRFELYRTSLGRIGGDAGFITGRTPPARRPCAASRKRRCRPPSRHSLQAIPLYCW